MAATRDWSSMTERSTRLLAERAGASLAARSRRVAARKPNLHDLSWIAAANAERG